MQTAAMERLTELVAEFRDEYGEPDTDDPMVLALLDITDAAEEVLENNASPGDDKDKSVDSSLGWG